MEVKVLGPGCPKCQALEQNTKDAIAELGLDVHLDHVTNPNEIAEHGVFMTPGLVVDGEVKIVGKVASKEEIKQVLSK
ncbi:MAG: TM0996/MTH895 family glutaredoxin-like protein [Deltaproteobacteria bacterium]|nr:TM0996/MTH895 family glutaredoxin-like protein [Deltaproteobacteria bacterium]MBW2070900.1 TM0996/MTH895 family glutaredoxin-like protein [Deltaproteobacteria bacterium]